MSRHLRQASVCQLKVSDARRPEGVQKDRKVKQIDEEIKKPIDLS